MRRDLRNSHHLATISYDGRFWDAYLELMETQGAGQPVRGRIAFSAADAGEAEPVRTTTIFIEDTPQEVVVRAREFKTHQLVALLRSSIPPDAPEDEEPAGPDTASGAGVTEEPNGLPSADTAEEAPGAEPRDLADPEADDPGSA